MAVITINGYQVTSAQMFDIDNPPLIKDDGVGDDEEGTKVAE